MDYYLPLFNFGDGVVPKLSNENSKSKRFRVRVIPPGSLSGSFFFASVTEYSSTTRIGRDFAETAQIENKTNRHVNFVLYATNETVSKLPTNIFFQFAAEEIFDAHPSEFEIGWAVLTRYFEEASPEEFDSVGELFQLKRSDRLFKLKRKYIRSCEPLPDYLN